MILNVFSVRDMATEMYGNPMFLVTKAQAIRTLADEVNRKGEGNLLSAHPGDYVLYHLGTFETSNGLFDMLKVPEQVVRAADLVASS